MRRFELGLKAVAAVGQCGIAAGVLWVGLQMHEAAQPRAADRPMATGYMTVADQKRPATLSDIDDDLRRINASIAGVSVAVSAGPPQLTRCN